MERSPDDEDDEEDEDDDGDDLDILPKKRAGILPFKGRVYLRLPDGRKVLVVDGTGAYPYATSWGESKLMVYFRKSVDADRNVKVVKINKEYYIVVTEMATSVSAGTNRELHIRQPYEHMVEYHEFAKETSYCFCIDTKIVNIHQPMRPFADEGEKIVGVVLSRVRLATDLPTARLQSASAALIEPASRAIPSKSPDPIYIKFNRIVFKLRNANML